MPSPKKAGSPGPGSTTSRTYAPRSNAFAPDETQPRQADWFPTGNAPPTHRCCNVWNPRLSASGNWRQRTNNSAKRWPLPSESTGPPPSSAAPTTRRRRNPSHHRTLLTTTSTTLSSSHHRLSKPGSFRQLKIRAVDLLAAVESARGGPDGVGALDRLGVHDRRGGLHVAAQPHPQPAA